MNRISLEQLSDLVLVEIMAALPMWAAVRLAQLGHQRLQAMSCRPWVLRRMSDVDFWAAVEAYQVDGREAFCSLTVLKKLYGRVGRRPYQVKGRFWERAILAVISLVPGHIHCNVPDRKFFKFLKEASVDICHKIKYLTSSTLPYCAVETRFPNLVAFSSLADCYPLTVIAIYWPALLNQRHVIDVLKAVRVLCVVSEDRARTEATANAKKISHSYHRKDVELWYTRWSMAM